jgi:hypothetical protein
MRCWHKPNEVHGFCTKDIIKFLEEMNPDYNLEFEDGEIENDVLAAFVK